MVLTLFLTVLLCSSLATGSSVEERSTQRAELIPCPGYENINPLKISELRISPEPAVLPGKILVKLAASLSRDVTSMYVRANITKVFFGGRTVTQIPCIQGYGSCLYNVCEMTKQTRACPDVMRKHGLPCKCPFHGFKAKDFEELIDVKTMPKALSWLLNGDYEARAEVMETPNSQPIACFIARASVTSKKLDCNNPLLKFSAKCKDIIG